MFEPRSALLRCSAMSELVLVVALAAATGLAPQPYGWLGGALFNWRTAAVALVVSVPGTTTMSGPIAIQRELTAPPAKPAAPR
jgi:hypothetical protein